jgi:Nif-specific regulatory protein
MSLEHTTDRLRLERDLYRRLLELGTYDDPRPFLRDALELVVGVTGARRGFLSMGGDDRAPAAFLASGFDDEEIARIQAQVSGGIIAQAISTGRTVHTDSALVDPRFSAHQSVQLNRISAVLCAPIGEDRPLGVVYLQDRTADGPFTEAERDRAELFARHLAPFVDRLALRQRVDADATTAIRARLAVDGLVGRSKQLADVLNQVEAAARFAMPVLLTGPSGTGKTAFARAIHDNSPRASGPFIELNCATLPEALFESELFGAEKGAHSTATRRMPGKIAAAEGGTLMLDEIGELPLALQGKLLQFLQSREYYALGSTTVERANVRVIAATNADLRGGVERRTFREDLYWRLDVLSIRMPPLDERRGDIEPLARHLASAACRRNELPEMDLSPSAIAALDSADWPGNIRQLGHVVEMAVIRAAMAGARRLERRHVFPDAADEVAAAEVRGPMTWQESTRVFQAGLLAQVLAATGWNISETARRLDLTRTHVRHLIASFGLRS